MQLSCFQSLIQGILLLVPMSESLDNVLFGSSKQLKATMLLKGSQLLFLVTTTTRTVFVGCLEKVCKKSDKTLSFRIA